MLAAVAGAFGSLDTALNVAFPDLVADLGLEVGDLQWVVVCYVLVYGGSLLAAGQLADSWGYRRTLRTGAAAATVAMILCAAAPTFGLLLAARALQGIATAVVLAAAPALLTSVSADRGRAVGVFQTAAAVGLAIGPVVGGPLVEWLGWRGVFWFRVPLGLLLLGLALAGRDDGAAAGASRRRSPKVDHVGTLLVSAALGAAVLALNLGGSRGWADPVVLGAMAASAALVVGFVVRSGRVEHPILDLRLFRSVRFATANVLAIVASGAMFATWLLVPTLLVNRLGVSVLTTGLVLAASPAATAVASAVAGRLASATTGAWWTLAGLVLEAVGMAGLSQVADGWSPLHVAGWMAVVGCGLGLFSVPNMAVVMEAVGDAKQGVGGGLSLMDRTIGIVAGVAIASAVVDRTQPVRGFLGAFELVFASSAAVLAIAALVGLVVGRSDSVGTRS